MKKFRNKKDGSILVVSTPNLIEKYEKDTNYIEMNEESKKKQEEPKENK